MPFNDLNIAYITDHAILSNTLLFAKELGYATVALSIAFTGKLPPEPPAVPLSSLKIPAGLEVLTRLTLTISDASQNHRLNLLSSSYDILALRPTDDKTLQQCCLSLECDLISLDLSHRLPSLLKFKTVASALQRGIRFEICYSPGIIGGSDARRNLVSGATQLIRATRGRGIVVSSEAKSALGLRGPWDVINLAQVWGLSQQRAKEAACEEAGKVIRFAGIKRTSYRGVVDVIDGGAEPSSQKSEKVPSTGNAKPTHVHKVRVPRAQAQTGTEMTGASSIKRKASDPSLDAPSTVSAVEEKPISKSEMKRRAKKARLGRRTVPLP